MTLSQRLCNIQNDIHQCRMDKKLPKVARNHMLEKCEKELENIIKEILEDGRIIG